MIHGKTKEEEKLNKRNSMNHSNYDYKNKFKNTSNFNNIKYKEISNNENNNSKYNLKINENNNNSNMKTFPKDNKGNNNKFKQLNVTERQNKNNDLKSNNNGLNQSINFNNKIIKKTDDIFDIKNKNMKKNSEGNHNKIKNNQKNDNTNKINKIKIDTKNKNEIKNYIQEKNIINNSYYKENNTKIDNKMDYKNNKKIILEKNDDKSKVKYLNNKSNKNLGNIIINEFDDEDKKQEEKKNDIYENYLCFECKGKALIKLNLNNLSVDMNCIKGHCSDNIEIKNFKKMNEFNQERICFECKKKNLQLEESYYCECHSIICKKCKIGKFHKKHFNIELSKKCYYCIQHEKIYNSFCLLCNKNICKDCLNEHNNHLDYLLKFEENIPKNGKIKESKDNLKKIKKNKKDFDFKFNKFIEKLINKKIEYDNEFDEIIKMADNIVNKIDNKNYIIYEDIENFTNLKFDVNKKNIINQYLNINNFYKEGRFLMELFGNSDKNEIVRGINNFSLISNKYNKKNSIYNKTNSNIVNKEKINNNEIPNSINIISKDNNQINNFKYNNQININSINSDYKNGKINENIHNLNFKEKKEDLKITEKSNLRNNILNIDQNNIIERKYQTIKVLEKIENCERKLHNKEERCIKCFSILRNNRILLVFKSGIIKVYEFENNDNPNESDQIKLKEILNLQQEEYCFNYCIELHNGNIAICSEDNTIKIIKLLFDEEIKENIDNYKLLQQINEIDPIYVIKELKNKSLVLGCWRNMLVYQKVDKYELMTKLFLEDHTFSILELSPNEIISSHTQTKTLTFHNLNKYKAFTINNIESNENNNIICKYNNKNEIVFVGYNKGINIVSIIYKCLIQKIEIWDIITSLSPMMFHLDFGDGKKEQVFGLLCGVKKKIYFSKTNYIYNLLQIGFNLNYKDRGIIDSKSNKKIDCQKISIKEKIHFYDINMIENSIFCKNNDSLKININKKVQWIFTSGNEDKTLKIWKI